jgi:hypothetical protein
LRTSTTSKKNGPIGPFEKLASAFDPGLPGDRSPTVLRQLSAAEFELELVVFMGAYPDGRS